MKRIFFALPTLCLSAVLLVACSGDASSSSTASSSTPASAISPSSTTAPASSAAPAADLEEMLASLSEAAGLGSTIDVSEMDLKARGLDTANMVAFAGAESQLTSENGGIVMIFQVQPGKAADMATALQAYRDVLANDDRYAEFAVARENAAGARIVEKGDVVIYAVSATGQDGGYDTLDAAITGIA